MSIGVFHICQGIFSKKQYGRVSKRILFRIFGKSIKVNSVKGGAFGVIFYFQGYRNLGNGINFPDTFYFCSIFQKIAVIGEVTEDNAGRVVMKTEIGSQTLLPQPGGELLPRIC